jgi:hypothetical protein
MMGRGDECGGALFHGHGVDEQKGHEAGRIRAVSPGMVGAALDQHIAGNELGLTDIHDRPDLAGENDRLVDGAGGNLPLALAHRPYRSVRSDVLDEELEIIRLGGTSG